MGKDQAKYKVSPKGKRKLDFPRKSSVKLPLIGKTIYLDIKEVKQQKRVEHDVRKLGGTIEEFLSKDINYLITSQPRPKVRKGSGIENGPESPAAPSPFSCEPSPSPSNPDDKKVQQTVTRGKALAEKARRHSNANNIVENAEKWGVKIVGLEAAYKWIEKELKKLPKHSPKATKNSQKSVARYRNFKAPYLKLEDDSCQYRPSTNQLEIWPRLNVDTPQGSCPFDGTQIAREDRSREERGDLLPAQVDIMISDTPREEKDALEQAGTPGTGTLEKSQKKSEVESLFGTPTILTAGEVRRRKDIKRRQERKRGYCEMCLVKYEDLDKHVRDDHHRAIVKEKSTFQELDKLITAGPNTVKFLRNYLMSTLQANKKSQDKTSQQDESQAGCLRNGDDLPGVSGRRSSTKGKQSETRDKVAVATVPDSASGRSASIKKQVNDSLQNLADKESTVGVAGQEVQVLRDLCEHKRSSRRVGSTHQSPSLDESKINMTGDASRKTLRSVEQTSYEVTNTLGNSGAVATNIVSQEGKECASRKDKNISEKSTFPTRSGQDSAACEVNVDREPALSESPVRHKRNLRTTVSTSISASANSKENMATSSSDRKQDTKLRRQTRSPRKDRPHRALQSEMPEIKLEVPEKLKPSKPDSTIEEKVVHINDMPVSPKLDIKDLGEHVPTNRQEMLIEHNRHLRHSPRLVLQTNQSENSKEEQVTRTNKRVVAPEMTDKLSLSCRESLQDSPKLGQLRAQLSRSKSIRPLPAETQNSDSAVEIESHGEKVGFESERCVESSNIVREAKGVISKPDQGERKTANNGRAKDVIKSDQGESKTVSIGRAKGVISKSDRAESRTANSGQPKDVISKSGQGESKTAINGQAKDVISKSSQGESKTAINGGAKDEVNKSDHGEGVKAVTNDNSHHGNRGSESNEERQQDVKDVPEQGSGAEMKNETDQTSVFDFAVFTKTLAERVKERQSVRRCSLDLSNNLNSLSRSPQRSRSSSMNSVKSENGVKVKMTEKLSRMKSVEEGREASRVCDERGRKNSSPQKENVERSKSLPSRNSQNTTKESKLQTSTMAASCNTQASELLTVPQALRSLKDCWNSLPAADNASTRLMRNLRKGRTENSKVDTHSKKSDFDEDSTRGDSNTAGPARNRRQWLKKTSQPFPVSGRRRLGRLTVENADETNSKSGSVAGQLQAPAVSRELGKHVVAEHTVRNKTSSTTDMNIKSPRKKCKLDQRHGKRETSPTFVKSPQRRNEQKKSETNERVRCPSPVFHRSPILRFKEKTSDLEMGSCVVENSKASRRAKCEHERLARTERNSVPSIKDSSVQGRSEQTCNNHRSVNERVDKERQRTDQQLGDGVGFEQTAVTSPRKQSPWKQSHTQPCSTPRSVRLVSSPRSGISNTPKSQRRKQRWSSRQNSSNGSGGDSADQPVKRRKLDKLKYKEDDVVPCVNKVKSSPRTVPANHQTMYSPRKSPRVKLDMNRITSTSAATENCQPMQQVDKAQSRERGENKTDSGFSLKWDPAVKSNKMKLNTNWSLLSTRSFSQLVTSDDDDESFEGFDDKNSQLTDLSFEEKSEVSLCSSEHEWILDEEEVHAAGREKDLQMEDFKKFLPATFSSPGKHSDSSWEETCESYFLSLHNSGSEVLDSERKNTGTGDTSEHRSPVVGSSGTGSRREACALATAKSKREKGMGVGVFDTQLVDGDIVFNYRSPQKRNLQFSPLKSCNGQVVNMSSPVASMTRSHLRTSTPSKLDSYYRKKKDVSRKTTVVLGDGNTLDSKVMNPQTQKGEEARSDKRSRPRKTQKMKH